MVNRISYDQTSCEGMGVSDSWYAERTDRNLGWLTAAEQESLRKKIVGVAGCGGMGGLLAATLIRLGVGEVRIADSEVFDISNLNRQFAATIETVGESKALSTAKMLREITTDTRLIVYPDGINGETVDDFIEGCDLICDEIEFWAMGSRILLHQSARKYNIPLINCSSVGFGTRLFLFDHAGMSIEEMFGIDLAQAMELQTSIQNGTAEPPQVRDAMCAVLDGLIPELPQYSSIRSPYIDRDACITRLLEEQRASIVSSNPPLASGFASNFAVLTLLVNSEHDRDVVVPPPTPGYLYFDSAKLIAKSVSRQEVVHGFYK